MRRVTRRRATSRGTTLLETMLVVSMLATVAAVLVPMLSDDSGVRLAATEGLLRDDLEQARHRTIASPHEAVALLLDEDGGGWRLVHDATRTPIRRSDGSAWTVRLGEGVAGDLESLSVARVDDPDRRLLRFDAAGLAIAEAPPRFRIDSGTDVREFEIGLVSGLIRSIAP